MLWQDYPVALTYPEAYRIRRLLRQAGYMRVLVGAARGYQGAVVYYKPSALAPSSVVITSPDVLAAFGWCQAGSSYRLGVN